MRKVTWGVIGAGGIALRRTIPEAVRDAHNIALDSVMDVDASRARQVAEKFGVPRAYGSLEEMLAQEEIDMVLITTPIPFHFANAMNAMAMRPAVMKVMPSPRKAGGTSLYFIFSRIPAMATMARAQPAPLAKP